MHALLQIDAPSPAAGDDTSIIFCNHTIMLMLYSKSKEYRATANPRLCRKFLDTHEKVWVSLLWGHCAFLLGPGAHKVLFVPSQSLFPQSCLSSGSSVVGLMATSSKRAYAVPKSAAPRAPEAIHCWPTPPQETLKHSSVSNRKRSMSRLCTITLLI